MKKIITTKATVNYKNYPTQYGELHGIEFAATMNLDGTFNVTICLSKYADLLRTKEIPESLPEEAVVSLTNVRNIGEYKNYQAMDKEMFEIPSLAECSVCHVEHNKDDQFILWYKGESYYITVV